MRVKILSTDLRDESADAGVDVPDRFVGSKFNEQFERLMAKDEQWPF